LSTKAIWTLTLSLFAATLFAFTACSTTTTEKVTPPPAPEGSTSAAIEEGVPGGVFVNTVEMQAKVIAIDKENRKVTLLGPEGEEETVKVGPGAVNFDQVKVGDMLKATLTEALVVFVDEEGATAPDGAAAMVELAPKGAQPGGVVAETVQITATITAMDTTIRTVTLEAEDGSTQTFPVRDDIDMSKHNVGEKVVFQVTEMIALSVEKQ
jgi:hypothetical protein